MTWFVVLFLFALAVIAAGYVWHTYGGEAGGGFFGPKAERRLGVIEQTSVDGKRRLILVRRDNVEHLIMTGGPVDVVVETGIGAAVAVAIPQRARPAVVADATDSPVAFGRAQRGVAPAAGE
jgi:flagellar protein FliO/FliZ